MTPNPYGPNIPWLSEDEYAKAVGQLRLALNGVFRPFHAYGLDVFVTPAIDQIVHLTEDFGLRVRGVDQPLMPHSNGGFRSQSNPSSARRDQ